MVKSVVVVVVIVVVAVGVNAVKALATQQLLQQ
jgi:hypothetical protein